MWSLRQIGRGSLRCKQLAAFCSEQGSRDPMQNLGMLVQSQSPGDNAPSIMQKVAGVVGKEKPVALPIALEHQRLETVLSRDALIGKNSTVYHRVIDRVEEARERISEAIALQKAQGWKIHFPTIMALLPRTMVTTPHHQISVKYETAASWLKSASGELAPIMKKAQTLRDNLQATKKKMTELAEKKEVQKDDNFEHSFVFGASSFGAFFIAVSAGMVSDKLLAMIGVFASIPLAAFVYHAYLGQLVHKELMLLHSAMLQMLEVDRSIDYLLEGYLAKDLADVQELLESTCQRPLKDGRFADLQQAASLVKTLDKLMRHLRHVAVVTRIENMTEPYEQQ